MSVHEELRTKSRRNVALKKQINEIYDEIRRKCSSFRYLYIPKTIVLFRKKQYDKMMSGHISKIAGMLRRDVDVDEHILNISSHQLTFFQKLVLCRGLKFAIPQRQRHVLHRFSLQSAKSRCHVKRSKFWL